MNRCVICAFVHDQISLVQSRSFFNEILHGYNEGIPTTLTAPTLFPAISTQTMRIHGVFNPTSFSSNIDPWSVINIYPVHHTRVPLIFPSDLTLVTGFKESGTGTTAPFIMINPSVLAFPTVSSVADYPPSTTIAPIVASTVHLPCVVSDSTLMNAPLHHIVTAAEEVESILVTRINVYGSLIYERRMIYNAEVSLACLAAIHIIRQEDHSAGRIALFGLDPQCVRPRLPMWRLAMVRAILCQAMDAIPFTNDMTDDDIDSLVGTTNYHLHPPYYHLAKLLIDQNLEGVRECCSHMPRAFLVDLYIDYIMSKGFQIKIGGLIALGMPMHSADFQSRMTDGMYEHLITVTTQHLFPQAIFETFGKIRPLPDWIHDKHSHATIPFIDDDDYPTTAPYCFNCGYLMMNMSVNEAGGINKTTDKRGIVIDPLTDNYMCMKCDALTMDVPLGTVTRVSLEIVTYRLQGNRRTKCKRVTPGFLVRTSRGYQLLQETMLCDNNRLDIPSIRTYNCSVCFEPAYLKKNATMKTRTQIKKKKSIYHYAFVHNSSIEYVRICLDCLKRRTIIGVIDEFSN